MKKIAAYLRLSLADKDLGENGKDESNSIENQRILIRNYLTAHSEIIGDVVEYKDDGFTGLNFNRPAFKEMIDDAKKGNISTIVVKDLSRFGRDYIGVGDYIEQILPSIDVRLIAINNRYDSNEQGASITGMDYSITNLINNMYSKDISKKVRSVFQTKWRQGINATGMAPYGYKVDKDDPTHQPQIDEEAAKVVRRIFAMAVDSYSTKRIAEYLNSEAIPTPMRYLQSKLGYCRGRIVSPPEEQLWNTHMVNMIIHRYDYTGARVHGSVEQIGVGLGKRRKKSKSEWIVVENNHEPIVSKSDYELAQLVIKQYKDASKFKNANDDILVGLVRCGCCRHVLQYLGCDNKIMYCQHATDVGSKSKCSREQYDKYHIRAVVLHSLRIHLDLLSNVKSILSDQSKKLFPKEVETVEMLQKKREELENEFVRRYEDYVNGNLDRQSFINAKERITEEKDQISNRLEEIEKGRDEKEKLFFEIDRTLNIGNATKDCSKIKRSTLQALIDVVYVKNSKEIEIKYKFEDLYKQALAELNKECTK